MFAPQMRYNRSVELLQAAPPLPPLKILHRIRTVRDSL